jgi:ribosomal protein L16 Arg81 hydroxylase
VPARQGLRLHVEQGDPVAAQGQVVGEFAADQAGADDQHVLWPRDRRLAQRSAQLQEAILALKPGRVILNPGTESVALEQALTGADTDAFAAWLGAYLSTPKEHLRLDPEDPPLTQAQFRRGCEAAGELLRHGWSRLLFCRGAGDSDLLFANGEVHRLPKTQARLLELITDERDLGLDQIAPWLREPGPLDLLCRLYNSGHYVVPD